MNQTTQSRHVNIVVALLGVWLIISPFAILWASPEISILGVALLIFVCALSILEPFRFSGWLVAILAIAGYAGAQIAFVGPVQTILLPSAIAAVVYLVTALLGMLAASRIYQMTRQLFNDLQLIEDLRIHDPKTNLVRFAYARQALKVEIMRSQRYQIDLCLLLMEVADWAKIQDERGMVEADEIKGALAEIVKSATREVDTGFVNGKLGVILPQTNPSGACVVAERLVANAARRFKLDLHVGIAHFPEDAVGDEELIRAAESALQFSLTAGHSIVFHHHMKAGVEAQAAGEGAAADA